MSSAKDALLQLPTDIIHTVFDHLRDDKKSGYMFARVQGMGTANSFSTAALSQVF